MTPLSTPIEFSRGRSDRASRGLQWASAIPHLTTINSLYARARLAGAERVLDDARVAASSRFGFWVIELSVWASWKAFFGNFLKVGY